MECEKHVRVYDARRCPETLADLLLVPQSARAGPLLASDGLPADGVDCLGVVGSGAIDEAVMRLATGGFGGVEYVGEAAEMVDAKTKHRLEEAFEVGVKCRAEGRRGHS